MLKNRFAFLLWFLGLLLGLVLAGMLLWSGLTKDPEPVIIDPDHPLPTEDSYAETLPNEGDAVVSEEGGGSVSMIYTLSVNASLSSGTAQIDFRNPSVSNHDVAIILYVVSNGQEYPIAQSGLLKAGNSLNTLELFDDAAILQTGTYSGKYLVLYYDPITGEKALVEPEITDLVITVTP